MNKETKILSEIIINEIHERPDVKSKILSKVKKKYWRGYCESTFVCLSKDIDNIMEELIEKKDVIYVKGKKMSCTKKGFAKINK